MPSAPASSPTPAAPTAAPPALPGASAKPPTASQATTPKAATQQATAPQATTPAATTPAVTTPAAPPPIGTLAKIPVFFATDRMQQAAGTVRFLTTRDESPIHYGQIDVTIPAAHLEAKIERPDIWTFYREDMTKHFVIVRRRSLEEDEFFGSVRGVVNHSRTNEAFVFVHGFNVKFDDAIYRTAQLAYDLDFDGAPILYSWPSVEAPTLVGYSTDRATADWTANHLRDFLDAVSARTGATRVHLIAHSMGNYALLRALEKMTSASSARFSKIFLSAPDVDKSMFVKLASVFRAHSEMPTLYASRNDKALMLSKKLQSYPRAGDTTNGVVTVPGIDSIDVSDLDTDFLGHSYFGDHTSIISDIRAVIRDSLATREAWTSESRFRAEPMVGLSTDN